MKPDPAAAPQDSPRPHEQDLLDEVEHLQGLIARQAEIDREQQARHAALAARLQAALDESTAGPKQAARVEGPAMKSDAPEPAETLNLLRQQLILAQVRIMELEDQRDQLAPRLAELETLLAGAQKLADLKLDEAAHLHNVAHGAQAHAAGLQAQLAAAAADLAATRAHHARDAASAAEVHASLEKTVRELTGRRDQLESGLAALQASRSWRWTGWLRSLERLFGGRS
jgi:chromosome segregation ATPase